VPLARRLLGRFGVYAGALAVVGFALLPFYWMVLTSVKTDADIVTETPVFWPSEFNLGRYEIAFERGFGEALRNSLLVASGTVVVGLLLAIFAAYVLARFEMPLRRYLLLLVMTVQMFPLVVLIIPLYGVFVDLHLLNTFYGLVLVYLAFALPLAIYMLRGFFASIPKDLEEAAMVDGCTRMQAIRKVVLPLVGPGLAATSILLFITAWNEFIIALNFTTDTEAQTLPVALTRFTGRGLVDWGGVMAFSTMMVVPVVIFFLLVHRRLTTGLVLGATKG
jgi:ABC-type glycerol-3-phosphate transport system permease component